MKIKYIFSYNRYTRPVILFLVFVCVYFILKVFVYYPTPNDISYTNTNFYVFDLTIPADLQFCGEKIPSNDFNIRKDLEKEFFTSAYWKNNSKVLFNKAQRWFPYIEPILKEEGVPDDFKYLCVIESHLSNASSGIGAAGFWQLVPSSARNYGLEVNSQVDERYHVEKATRAACAHIKDAYKIFNNWTLAAAAYNRGIGGIQKALAVQKSDNYFDLLLNKETGSFVYRIMAYKTLFSSPGHFGIKKKRWSYYSKIPFKIYKVDTTLTSIAAFEKMIDCPPGTISFFNPWLLTNELDNPEKKVYEIRVPKNVNADYSGYKNDLLADVNVNYETLVPLPGEIKLKSDSLVSVAVPARFTVKVQEPLKNLAVLLKVKEEDLRKWNNLPDAQNVEPGQTLVIYRTEPLIKHSDTTLTSK
jgi:membrane-bound lytic murein transglycosylase D